MYIRNLADQLRKGKVPLPRGFAFKGPLPPNLPKEHFCFVINRSVRQEDEIKYVWCTRKGDKALDRLLRLNDPKALVEIQPSEYSELDSKSYVQCSQAFIKTIAFSDFVDMLDQGECQQVNPLPSNLIDRIIEAIGDSVTLSTQAVKRLLE